MMNDELLYVKQEISIQNLKPTIIQPMTNDQGHPAIIFSEICVSGNMCSEESNCS